AQCQGTGISVLRNDLDVDLDKAEVLGCTQATLISHRLLNPVHQHTTPRLRLVLFPQYKKNAQFSLTRLSPAQAGLRLMACLVNARNLPDHGFRETARISRIVSSYAVEYGSFKQFGDEMAEFLDRDLL
ncbi:MAG: hypothetical protein OEU36_18585, partial [Gammaproteobacteria bacterium]|nr:hypothetical protein [Gammaproteobacteria bacterium]